MTAVTQGDWGQRIADHILKTSPPDWQITCWTGPANLPRVIDEPGDWLPPSLPAADLLLVLAESPGLTDLAPDLAQRAGARAVIVPVDRRAWAPPGLIQQVRQRLEAAGLASAFPAPFCSLAPNPRQHPLIRAFAQRYGSPLLSIRATDGRVASCGICREAPCGNTRYIAERLAEVRLTDAAEQAGLLHHYYPCWGGMDEDPVHGTHTLLHIAATISQKAVARAIQELGDPPQGEDDG